MRMRSRYAVLVLIVAAASCSEPLAAAEPANAVTAEDRRVSRADSAGVEIVTTSAPIWDRDHAWSLSPSPFLAATDSSLGLGRIVAMARLASGHIAVGDPVLGTVLLLDSTGTVARRIEGRVAGRPLRQLFWLGATGDTLLAYDIAENRFLRIPRQGEATAVALRTVSQSSFTALRPIGVFAGGGILAVSGGSSFPFPGEEFEVVQDSAVLLRYAPSGEPGL